MILTKRQRVVAEHLASYVKQALENDTLYWIDTEDKITKRLGTLPSWLYDELIMSRLIGENGRHLSYDRLMRILDSLISLKLLESSPEERERIIKEDEIYAKNHRPGFTD